MHCLQTYLFKYMTVAAFFLYTQRGEVMKVRLKLRRLEDMENTLLIMEKSWNTDLILFFRNYYSEVPLGQMKKISVFWMTGLKILGRQGTHIF